MIPSETERAWAAGFFDGEGCWHTVRPKYNLLTLQLTVANSYLPALERFQKVCGGRICRKQSPSMSRHRQPFYTLRISNRRDLAFAISMLRPYMGTQKREQLKFALRRDRESHSIPLEIRKDDDLFKQMYPHLVSRSVSAAQRETA